MSKKKEQITTAFQLASIEVVGTGLNIPEGFKPMPDYQFNVFLESRINKEKQLVMVTNRVDIHTGEEQYILGYIKANYWFSLTDFDEVIKKDKKGVYKIPESLQLSFNAIAISTTRGLLFAMFKGTTLHNAILPVIDPVKFEINEVNI